MAIGQYIGFAFKGSKKYYFTGNSFDSSKVKAKVYKTTASLKKAVMPYAKQLPTGYGIKAEEVIKQAPKKATHRPKKKVAVKRKSPVKRSVKKPAKKRVSRRRKNPVPLSRAAKIEEAMRRYIAFSGHEPEFIDEYPLTKSDVMFKVGMCDGVMYTTVRDGKTEKYVHRFKSRARPILASKHDGSMIGFVDGNYTFTERGIVDN